MNDKNIKKQPSAQALDDDALENVAGGWYYSDWNDGYHLLPVEYTKLIDAGYTPELHSGRDQAIFLIKDKDGNYVSPREVEKILGKSK